MSKPKTCTFILESSDSPRKHINSEGELEIPNHVVFDLPELLTVLNRVRPYPLFDETRIYESTGITLFPRKQS